MKILVTGSRGQVGRELQKCQWPAGYSLLAFDHSQLDISERDHVIQMIKETKADYVINTAAYTAVDKAEENQALAFRVNTKGAENLAQACMEHRIPLIHLSTDYVFSGEKSMPYIETDPTAPINTYGLSKLQGEQAIQSLCEQYFILRLSGVFSSHGNNFVKTILNLANAKDELNIVTDQTLCPTAASDIANTIVGIVGKLGQITNP